MSISCPITFTQIALNAQSWMTIEESGLWDSLAGASEKAMVWLPEGTDIIVVMDEDQDDPSVTVFMVIQDERMWLARLSETNTWQQVS